MCLSYVWFGVENLKARIGKRDKVKIYLEGRIMPPEMVDGILVLKTCSCDVVVVC